jgi:TrmH family RNA methyltransferase
MVSTEIITSLQNPIVKRAIRLREKSRDRELEKLFFVEGVIEVKRAIANGFVANTIFFPDNCDTDASFLSSPGQGLKKSILVSQAVFEKISVRGVHSKVCALFTMPEATEFKDYLNPKVDRVLFLLESPEKPGNIGAVCRSIDGAGFSKVLTTGQAVDMWNPQAIRSSIGSILRIRPIHGRNEDFFEALKFLGYEFHGLLPGATKSLYDPKVGVISCLSKTKTNPLVFVFGEESRGLSEWWVNRLDQAWNLPMLGIADSLNLSVSVALVAYEIRRLLGAGAE